MCCANDDLDEGQKLALRLFQDGKSVALVGGGGTGKSYLLKKIVEVADTTIGGFPFVAPCAHSNKNAEALNGVTIHKLFGAKPSWEFSKEYLLEGLKFKPRLREQLKKIRVLIIDELSMLTSNVVDAMDHVLRHFAASEWHSSLPLGGRQLIVSGDPYQLEPYEESGRVQKDTRRTAFQSRTWYLTFGAPGDGVVINFGSNHRQSRDPDFFSMLNRIRVGQHTHEDISQLNRLGENQMEPPSEYTRLCLTNEQVSRINRRNLTRLPGSLFQLSSIDTFFSKVSAQLQRRLDGVAPTVLTLKHGAHVIITRKMEVPGGTLLPGVQAIVRRIQKLDSRSNGLRYTVIVEILPAARANQGSERSRLLDGVQVRIFQETFEVHSFDRTVLAKREQLPLIPAYALTVHRSQGMTFSRVAINFEVASRWKPHGMAYVALSRCKSSEGLLVSGLNDTHISVSERARDLMKELWQLHLNMPNRIWGVNSLSCLSLSSTDLIDQRQEALCHTSYQDLKVQKEETFIGSEGLFEASVISKNILHQAGKEPLRIWSIDEDDGDAEVVFVSFIKRRRKS